MNRTLAGKVRPWLTHLYPRAWRERYAVEFEALLEECLRSPLDIVDVFLGAVDAHLQLLNGDNLTWRLMNMLNKLRTTILIVFAAFIGFVIAGFGLLGLNDDSPMIPLMNSRPALAIAWDAIAAGSVVALLAIVIGGAPLALTVVRRALASNHQGLGLLLVPAASFAALVIYAAFVWSVGNSRIHLPGVVPVVQPGSFPEGNRLLLAGLMLVFVLGAITSTWAVWRVVSGTDVEEETFHAGGRSLTVRVYTFAYLPAVVAALAMLVMLIATAAWGWMAFTALPDVFRGSYGPWQTSTQAWYFGILALMAACTATAFWGLRRSRSARVGM